MMAEESTTELVRNVEYWTVAFGAAGALAAGLHWGWPAAAGVAVGAVLSLANYRWLKQGVIALTSASLGQAGAEKVRVPRGVRLKLFGRFVLVVAVVCVILWRFRWLAVPVVVGFFALVAGVLAAMIVHLFRNMRQA
jgi:hypothetical protein